MTWRPIFWASIAISRNSLSLKPLQMIGAVGVGHGDDGQQFRLAARFEAESIRHPEADDLLDHLPLLVDLDGIDARIAALVAILPHGVGEGAVDFGDAVLENPAEADQDRQAQSPHFQAIGQFFQIDGPFRIAFGMDQQMAVRRAH